LWLRKARARSASAGSYSTSLSTVVSHTPSAGSGLEPAGAGSPPGRGPRCGLTGAPLAGAGAVGWRTADGVEIERGLREGGAREGEAEGGSEGDPEGGKESGTGRCKGARGATARAGAEGCWSGPGRAIVVAGVGRGWPAAASGPPRACGASRVSSRAQDSHGHNAHRAAPSEHRLGFEPPGRSGGGAVEWAAIGARTEAPEGWQQDGPRRGVPARRCRYPATGLGRQPALGSCPVIGVGSGWALSGSCPRSAQGFGRGSR